MRAPRAQLQLHLPLLALAFRPASAVRVGAACRAYRASAAAGGSTGGAPTTAATSRRTTTPRASEADAPVESTNFIRNIIKNDLASGKHASITTRFPPEPNGYLHLGHAKSICVNFGLGAEFDGVTYMRFDDTNPEKEEQEYVDSIQRDVKWLGFDWGDKLSFASNYFDQFYEYALTLIRDGRAYVDELSPEEMREYRGSLTSPGKNSPYRERPAAESEKLFTEMAQGVHPDGSMILRLKVRDCAILVHPAQFCAIILTPPSPPPTQDRHGVAKPQPPRPANLPDQARRRPPDDGRQVEGVPDVRLRALGDRRPRRDHPLPLHARVRGPPRALRFCDRRAPRAVDAAPD